MDVWMGGWMEKRMNGWMGRWMVWLDGWVDEGMDGEYTNGCMNG